MTNEQDVTKREAERCRRSGRDRHFRTNTVLPAQACTTCAPQKVSRLCGTDEDRSGTAHGMAVGDNPSAQRQAAKQTVLSAEGAPAQPGQGTAYRTHNRDGPQSTRAVTGQSPRESVLLRARIPASTKQPCWGEGQWWPGVWDPGTLSVLDRHSDSCTRLLEPTKAHTVDRRILMSVST